MHTQTPEQRAKIATLAAQVVNFANSTDTRKNAILDEQAKPLIEELRQQGLIDAGHGAFVEWQGVWEFGHVPVCSAPEPDMTDPNWWKKNDDSWLCVKTDGAVIEV